MPCKKVVYYATDLFAVESGILFRKGGQYKASIAPYGRQASMSLHTSMEGYLERFTD
jgi:hypothetical protein